MAQLLKIWEVLPKLYHQLLNPVLDKNAYNENTNEIKNIYRV